MGLPFLRLTAVLWLTIASAQPGWSWITWHVATHEPTDTSVPHAVVSSQVDQHTHNYSEDSVDILSLLNVSSTTPGVTVLQGSAPGFPAYKFRPTFDQVQLPHPDIIGQMLTRYRGFTIVFIYRQHRKSLGTLISVNSPGRVNPWFQLTSNLRTGQLVVHYRITSDSKLHQTTWMLDTPTKHTTPIGGYGWTHLSLTLDAAAGSWILELNCNAPLGKPLAGPPPAYLDVPEDSLVYFRQEPGFKKKFLGAMKMAKIWPYPSKNGKSFWSCP